MIRLWKNLHNADPSSTPIIDNADPSSERVVSNADPSSLRSSRAWIFGLNPNPARWIRAQLHRDGYGVRSTGEYAGRGGYASRVRYAGRGGYAAKSTEMMMTASSSRLFFPFFFCFSVLSF